MAVDMEKFADGVVDLVERAVKPLALRMSELENRAVKFAGVYQTSSDYVRGDLVTHKGALWHCNRPTTERPGDGGDWQLAVKRGDA